MAALCIHGYHPLSEDGGLYVAGIEWKLDSSLFAYDRSFVTAHLSYSVFAPLMAAAVRWTHLPLLYVVAAAYIGTLFATVLAIWRLAARIVRTSSAAVFSTSLLTAWLTMPVAGTSLAIADPYLTARSFSLPLSLFAICYAIDACNGSEVGRRRWNREDLRVCCGTLLLAALFHPLMAFYGFCFVLCVMASATGSVRARIMLFMTLPAVAIAATAMLQLQARAESAASVAAAYSRYYWFLSQWQWFEWVGIAAPIALLLFLRRRVSGSAKHLVEAAVVSTSTAAIIAILFAHEGYATHLVARLQPLRMLQVLYIVMTMLLAEFLCNLLQPLRYRAALLAFILVASGAGMFLVQRAQYPRSAHVEFPWNEWTPRNPWSQAFLWCRLHTPQDAVFALDARYVNTEGEDAQTFRATSLRSMLPDYSKDGGEAAITPALAPAWRAGAEAQKNLSGMTDAERDPRIVPLGANWMVFHADAMTAHTCPYRNAVVKVCSLSALP